MDEIELHQGLPEYETVLSLLNEAFGDWGGTQLLEWKYNQYPEYDSEHNFYFTENGQLIAFRRLFDKNVVSTSGQTHRFFVHGDTCVRDGYQGEGLYSRLYSETTDFCKNKNRKFSCTFNRVGNITYEAKRDWGWKYQTLPVQLRILSPEVVLRQYARSSLQETTLISDVLDRTGHRFGLSFNDGELLAGELIGNQYQDPSRAIYLPLPESIVTTLVEAVSRENSFEAVRRRISPQNDVDNSKGASTTVRRRPFEDDFIESIHDLYRSVTGDYDLHFRRDYADIKHMLQHPNLEEVVTIERSGELLGVAPVCFDTDDAVFEAQVLDLAVREKSLLQKLLQRVESLAVGNGADLIVVITNNNLGSRWARVDQQVMMWEEYETDTAPFAEQSLRIGLYDVV